MKITLAFVILAFCLLVFSIAAPPHTTPAAGSGFDDAASPLDTVVSSCGFKKDSDHRKNIW